MSIGYACITLGEKDLNLRTVRVAGASDDNLSEVIACNLDVLDRQIDYLNKNNIRLFRISSDLIPLATHDVNKVPWAILYQNKFSCIGKKIKESNIRVSMHPGQYTVLNSTNAETVQKAVAELAYHESILSLLGTEDSHKIVLHIGGVYQDKKLSIERFIRNFNLLSDSVKRRLVIENDDKSYTAAEVLDIGRTLSIPCVYDNLHHQLNPSLLLSDCQWIEQYEKTWKKKDGKMKIHYSQQNQALKNGSHSKTIDSAKFFSFYQTIADKDIDIMLEVKDKNLSAVKLITIMENNTQINRITDTWARYKYLIMSNDLNDYNLIKEKLSKNTLTMLELYQIIEKNMIKPPSLSNQKNAAYHVMGYFKKESTEGENKKFSHLLSWMETPQDAEKIRKFLFQLAKKYQKEYLLQSYYFII